MLEGLADVVVGLPDDFAVAVGPMVLIVVTVEESGVGDDVNATVVILA